DLDRIREYMEARFSLSSGGQPLELRFTGHDVRFVDWGDFVMLTYASTGLEAVPDTIDIHFSPFFEWNSDHRDMVIIEHNWKTGTFNNEASVSLIMSPGNTNQTLDLTSSSVLRGFVAMIWQGVWHILIGLDHILFLIALVLPAVLTRQEGRWKPAEDFRTALIKLVAIVTFFTIAHSVTLSLAALDMVRFPSRLIESIIAASIAVAAAANLMPQLHIREWSIAFLFGLFHGFGFATVLGDIGLAREFLVLTLLGFNIGVELGQIAIVILVFPVLFLLRGTILYRWIFRAGSVFLILIALHWVAERGFGWSLPIRRILSGFLG
ncbi:MAG: HupE/UreJ family protein, partial [Gemmatimonadetes bacterium]|nr:HupE/UreJ family protein [Gemmatimonadota bacterium]